MTNMRDLYIDNSLISSYQGDTLFDDVYIEHNSLPEINFEDIDTKSEIFGKEISFPLIINAMTGGTERGMEINSVLYTIAKELNLPLAVGSQEDSLDSKISELFIGHIDDDLEKDIVLISNLSAKAKPEEIDRAMKAIDAKGISLYLNAAQEAVSYDGDTKCKGVLENISKLTTKYSDNLLIKEKSMGMSEETIRKLIKAGVKYIDLSGAGGTNFIEMENLRNYRNDFSDLYSWGIPTAKAIINARNVDKDVKIIASGGIKTSLDIVKSFVLGADYVGISGEVLRYVLHGGYEQAKSYLNGLIYKTKVLMFLLGVTDIKELKNVEYKITGKLKEII
ncbi:type 2 isopentenyl-diphosphate Delta-isomerase [Helcococcus kunzii]|uniref:type 2 isopentenyl-diphosphate Delta-isomerase n=1 Tax=Helcococcus kunzii TaxID=40091 RepID=UPI0024AD9C7F|nr:type 2 isopentenyl-diphosphate Delta-isomerase [Helcococcus kunzii]